MKPRFLLSADVIQRPRLWWQVGSFLLVHSSSFIFIMDGLVIFVVCLLLTPFLLLLVGGICLGGDLTSTFCLKALVTLWPSALVPAGSRGGRFIWRLRMVFSGTQRLWIGMFGDLWNFNSPTLNICFTLYFCRGDLGSEPCHVVCSKWTKTSLRSLQWYWCIGNKVLYLTIF